MQKSKHLFLICFLILFACKEKNQKLYSLDSICECYSQSEFIGLDETLNGCLGDFNNAINKKKKETASQNLMDFEETNFKILMKELIQSCPKYQKNFNNVLLSRYSERSKENLDVKKDSLLNLIDSAAENKAPKYIHLSEVEILNEDFDKALQWVNTSIEINPNLEMSYFVRGFLYHRKGDLKNALLDFKTMRSLTKEADWEFVVGLWILNLEQELK